MALPLWNSKTAHATQLCLHPNDGVSLGICGSGHSSNINRKKGMAVATKVLHEQKIDPSRVYNIQHVNLTVFLKMPQFSGKSHTMYSKSSKILKIFLKYPWGFFSNPWKSFKFLGCCTRNPLKSKRIFSNIHETEFLSPGPQTPVFRQILSLKSAETRRTYRIIFVN